MLQKYFVNYLDIPVTSLRATANTTPEGLHIATFNRGGNRPCAKFVLASAKQYLRRFCYTIVTVRALRIRLNEQWKRYYYHPLTNPLSRP